MSSKLDLSTVAVHADSFGVDHPAGRPVAPPISVSTTFQHPTPEERKNTEEPTDKYPEHHMYSRVSSPTLERVEKLLEAIIGAPTLLYASGIAASFAVITHYRPDVIAITDGYHGVHGAIQVYSKIRPGVKVIKLDDDFPAASKERGNFLAWLETPLNPTGESRNIQYYADKAHKVGGTLAIDSTFGPPPLQDPFKWGADCVMHSGTKYFNGHSDALSGTVSVKSKEDWQELWSNRTYTGSNPGSLEGWLVLRSLRSLKLRVTRQSETATKLAQFLYSLTTPEVQNGEYADLAGMIGKVWHTSLQEEQFIGEGKQMTSGPPTFSIYMTKPFYADELPNKVKFFVSATSLGGVESLMEQRILSDPGADPALIRLSLGLEEFEDLKQDVVDALRALRQAEKK